MKTRSLLLAAELLLTLPAIALAQQPTGGQPGARDTGYTRAGARTQRTARGAVEVRGRHGRMGAYGRGNFGLSHDQVTELQQALQSANCDPGPIDGIIGPRTRRAMACARQQNSLSGNNVNDLFRSLNLSFSASDSMGTGGVGPGSPLNQTQSGVTNAKTGESTLGPDVKRVRPTGIEGPPAGAGRAANRADSAKNQTQSGVTNAKTGQSTLGPGIKDVRPTGVRGAAAGDTTKRDTTQNRPPKR